MALNTRWSTHRRLPPHLARAWWRGRVPALLPTVAGSTVALFVNPEILQAVGLSGARKALEVPCHHSA